MPKFNPRLLETYQLSIDKHVESLNNLKKELKTLAASKARPSTNDENYKTVQEALQSMYGSYINIFEILKGQLDRYCKEAVKDETHSYENNMKRYAEIQNNFEVFKLECELELQNSENNEDPVVVRQSVPKRNKFIQFFSCCFTGDTDGVEIEMDEKISDDPSDMQLKRAQY